MGAFLRQLWPFIAPHRGRLMAGALSGLIYALGGTLLLLAVKLVLDAIFPTEGARDLVQSLGMLPAVLRDPLMEAMKSLRSQVNSGSLVWIIASVPMAMVLRGGGAYLSLYSMTWWARRRFMTCGSGFSTIWNGCRWITSRRPGRGISNRG